jgi:hypothetical protein
VKPNSRFTAPFPAALVGALLFYLGLALSRQVGPLASFFAPAAFIWTTVRHGVLPGTASAFLAAALLLNLAPTPSAALSFLAGNALPGVLCGALAARRVGIVPSALAAASAAVILSAAASGLQFLLAGVDPLVFMKYQYGDIIREVQFSLENMTGGAAGPQAAETAAFMSFLSRALPAILFVTVCIQFSANSLLAVSLPFRALKTGLAPPSLASFSLPERTVWLLIPSLAVLLFLAHPFRTVALNLTIVLLFLYLLQGLSIAVHLMDRFAVSRPVRMLFLIAALLQPYILLFPVVAGLLDFRFDFRRPRPAEEP